MYGELLATVSAFCWAAGGILYKKGLEYTDIWTGNLIRTSIAAFGFLAIMGLEKILIELLTTITLVLFFWLFFSAFFAFFVGDILYLKAIKRCGVSKAVPVSSTYPLFVALWAIIIYKHVISFHVFAGATLIVLAIYLISEKRESQRDFFGIILALFAAFSWSLSISTIDYLVLYLPAEAVAGFRFLIASIITSAIISVKGLKFSHEALKWLGIGAIFALIIGNYAFVEAIRVVNSARITPISATYPVIAAVFARLALKEALTINIVLGIFLSFIGVLLVVLS